MSKHIFHWPSFLRVNVLWVVSLIVVGCSPTAPTPITNPATQVNQLASPVQVIRLVYSDVEAFPIQMGNGTAVAEPPGIAVALIEQAAKEMGVTVTFERLPNVRVLAALEEGSADGAFCFSFKEERLQSGQYPMLEGKPDSNRRITTISYYLYKNPDSALDWDGTQILNLKGAIGANTGYSIVDDLRKKGVEVEEAKSTEQNLTKLQMGRLAGYATQDITADPLIATGLYGPIVKVPTPLATKDYFLMFSHQFMAAHPDIAERLWEKISQLRDPFIQAALPQYLPTAK